MDVYTENNFVEKQVTQGVDYTILRNKHRGPTTFDDMHRPTILGSNEVPKINITFVDMNEDYNTSTVVI